MSDVAGEADIEQQFVRAVVIDAQHLFRAPEIEAGAARALQRQADIFQRGQMGKHRGDLEAAHQAEPRDLGRLHAGDVAVLEMDRAAGRRQEGGEQIEAGGLAGAVRADQGMDGAGAHAQRHIVHGDEAAEFRVKAVVSRMMSLTPDVSFNKVPCGGR